jgi:hypothetical protein
VQASGQSAHTEQGSLAGSAAVQVGPSNRNEPVGIGSSGNGGNVTQTNDAASSAKAGNTATTTQTTNETQGGSGVQAIGQDASTKQLAGGLSLAKQVGAENVSSPVRVWSPGADGSVNQTNSAASSASAGNTATTPQSAAQTQGSSRCGCSGTQVQAVGQSAETTQGALAASAALQLPGREACGCSSTWGNVADPVRIWSPGGGGSVSQTNDAASSATSGNTATTSQTASQLQSSDCGCSGTRVQAIGQLAPTHQGSLGLSLALQGGPANSADPARIWSRGDDGSSSQGNDAASRGAAGNTARTTQTGTPLLV